MFLICKNLSLLHPKVLGALLWVWLNLALWFWTTRSLIFVNVFHYFIIVSPWDRVWPFNWTNLNPLQPRILCTKIGWNWTSGSGEYVNVKSLQTLSIRGGYCGTNLTMLDFEKKSKNFLDDLCIFQTYVILMFPKDIFDKISPHNLTIVFRLVPQILQSHKRSSDYTDKRRTIGFGKAHWSFQLKMIKQLISEVMVFQFIDTIILLPLKKLTQSKSLLQWNMPPEHTCTMSCLIFFPKDCSCNNLYEWPSLEILTFVFWSLRHWGILSKPCHWNE